MIDRLPDHDDPNDQIGPYYGTAGLRRRLGISRQAISQRVDRNTLLGVEADDGSILYPVFQFTADMAVLDGLPSVLKELHRVAEDGFSKAVWLTTPDDNLGGRTAIEWLREIGDVSCLVADARADVGRLIA